jgi:hypothetical protein
MVALSPVASFSVSIKKQNRYHESGMELLLKNEINKTKRESVLKISEEEVV